MANGKLLRQLIRSGLDGDIENFKAASEAVIAEERGKNHHLLANDLEKLLYGTQSGAPVSQSHMKLASVMPTNKDSGLSLLELRPVVREQRDIVLSDGAHSSLDEIIMEHNRADTLRSFGLQPSMPLIVVRLDSVISSFLGETASNLRKVFDYISKYPSVALFDEFDALAKDRGDSADHGELKRSVNAVLQMMDGYRGQSILVATTNYETLLDKAVWRRFDEVMQFDLPTIEQIKRLLSIKLSGVRRNFEPDDTKIASLFKGMSHADIERVLRRAVKEMVISGKEFLEKQHIDSGLARERRVSN